MKLGSLIVFAVGYVLGARAGHDRYAQIAAVAKQASQRLDEIGSRHRADEGDHASR